MDEVPMSFYIGPVTLPFTKSRLQISELLQQAQKNAISQ